jgi:glycine cleavage system aminomethyltransferase T
VAMGYVKYDFSKPGTKILLEVRGKNVMLKYLNFLFIKKVM